MMNTKLFSILLAGLVAAVAAAVADPLTPVPEKIPFAVADRQDFQIPDRVHQTGWGGLRSTASITNRLEKVNLDRLIDGFRNRPGKQAWDGEHVGKWLHAGTLDGHAEWRKFRAMLPRTDPDSGSPTFWW
jgi:hypothetical protein